MSKSVVQKPKSISSRLKISTYEDGNVLTMEGAKELIGWQELPDDAEEPGQFRDLNKKKIKLTNNSTNRPLRLNLAKRYMSEMLRNKWKLNGETIVFDTDNKCQSGQHRLVGLILAEQTRQTNAEFWKRYGWDGPIGIECVVIHGIDPSPETVDTIDQGQKRSLGDVIYRDETFEKAIDAKLRQKLSNLLAGAARLVWLRCGGKKVSDAPHFPVSEALDFVKFHPGLIDSVSYIHMEEGGGGVDGLKLSKFISPAYAAGLLYLMSTSGTDPDDYRVRGVEALDMSLKPKAQEFWTVFGSGANLDSNHPIYVLKEELHKMSASSAMARDLIVGMTIKAFNAWMDDRTVSSRDIKIELVHDEKGKPKPFESPRLGGLDIEEVEKPVPHEIEVPEPVEVEAETFEIGQQVWVFEERGPQWQGAVKNLYVEDDVPKALIFHPKKKTDVVVDVTRLSAEKWQKQVN